MYGLLKRVSAKDEHAGKYRSNQWINDHDKKSLLADVESIPQYVTSREKD